jgi:hypothetical protein
MFLKTTLTCGNKPGCRWGFEVSMLGEGHCLGPKKVCYESLLMCERRPLTSPSFRMSSVSVR